MQIKRIVITGGPGSGKTTLIQQLEERGFNCLHEISREVTLRAQEEGIDQLFLEDPLLFSQKLLEGRLEQFNEAVNHDSELLFYDRGLPDVTAYMDYLGTTYPESFDITCKENLYDAIFLLPPWESIYIRDNERYESYEEAEKICTYLLNGYQKYGYAVNIVPIGTVEERIDHIIESLSPFF